MTSGAFRRPAPMHLWIVGSLSLLWNAGGAYDHVMTNIRDTAYLADRAPEMIQLVDEFPYWVLAVWAVGVWGAVAGSALLLLRSRFAVQAFALSLAGLAGNFAYQATLALPAEVKTASTALFIAAIWAAAIALLVYSVRLRKSGVLR